MATPLRASGTSTGAAIWAEAAHGCTSDRLCWPDFLYFDILKYQNIKISNLGGGGVSREHKNIKISK